MTPAAVADDQLALAAADRDHGVDRLEPRLQRLFHGLALDDAGRDDLDLATPRLGDRAAPIHRPPQRVHDAADEPRPHRHLEHATRATDFVALAQHQVVAENDRPDVVLFEVQGLAGDLLAGLRGGEFEHFAGHRRGEPVEAGDTVLDLQDRAHLADVDFGQVRGLDFLEEDLFELAGTENGVAGHRLGVERL